MSLMLILTYAGPTLGILGFIVSPGLTIIFPWCREKLSSYYKVKVHETLNKNYKNMSLENLKNEWMDIKYSHSLDWRPKIHKKKKELKRELERYT